MIWGVLAYAHGGGLVTYVLHYLVARSLWRALAGVPWPVLLVAALAGLWLWRRSRGR